MTKIAITGAAGRMGRRIAALAIDSEQFDIVSAMEYAGHGELGEVTEVIEDGGGTLLRVEGQGRGLLVPFVDAFLVSVDVAAGRIELALPPGLVEICSSAEPSEKG